MMKEAKGAMRLLGRSRFAGVGVYTAGLVYQVLLHFLDDTVNHETPIWLRVAIILCIHTLFYTFVKFCREYLLPVNRGQFQIVKAILVLAVAATLRGVLLYSMTNTFHLYTLDSLGFRLANSVQVMVVVYGIIGLSDQGYREWQARKRDLLNDNARLVALLKQQNEKSEVEHQRLIDTVTGQLLRFVRDIERSTPGNIVSNLRGGIANIVRPLSHEIDERDFELPAVNPAEAKVSWRQLVQGIAGIRPIEPAVSPILLMLSAFPYLQLHFGTANAFKVGLVVIVLGISVLGIFDLAASKIKNSWIVTWLVMVVAAVTASGLVVVTVGLMIPGGIQPNKLMLILATFLNVVMAMIALNKSLFIQIASVEQELLHTKRELTWALARETEVQRQRSRTLAMALHGPVQTAVGAGIIRLENAAKSGEIPEPLINEVSDLIFNSLEQLQRVSDSVDLNQVFTELGDTWEGICAIQTRHSKAILKRAQQDAVSASLVAECVPELSFNAIKHGEAKNISIEILKPKNDTIQILVEDDGKKFTEGPKLGLGLKHLNESALAVDRDYVNGRNITKLTLPFKPCNDAQ